MKISIKLHTSHKRVIWNDVTGIEEQTNEDGQKGIVIKGDNGCFPITNLEYHSIQILV